MNEDLFDKWMHVMFLPIEGTRPKSIWRILGMVVYPPWCVLLAPVMVVLMAAILVRELFSE